MKDVIHVRRTRVFVVLVDNMGVLISTRLSPGVSKQRNVAIIVVVTSSETLAFKPIALSITLAKLHPILNSRSVSRLVDVLTASNSNRVSKTFSDTSVVSWTAHRVTSTWTSIPTSASFRKP